MASTVVIGVGGTGRGVINWLKYYSQRDFPTLAGNMELYIIDGPNDDDNYHVIDPIHPSGEVYITQQGNLANFYQLKKSPTNIINSIANPNQPQVADPSLPYVKKWLIETDAKKINLNYCHPTGAGFGQSRAPAKACFYMESAQMNIWLNNLINRANPPSTIILIGSLVGGTGAGVLNEIATLIRENINSPTIQFIGITALAQGYGQSVFSPEEISGRDARCFAGIREIQRQSGTDNYPRDIAKGVTIKNINRLYNASFIVDGNTLTESVSPVNGICNAIANGILSITSAPMEANIATMVANPGTFPDVFRSFGVHAYVYSPEYTMDLMAYRFVQEFYNKIISLDTDGISLNKRLTNIFNTSPFTANIISWSKGQAIEFIPPSSESQRAIFESNLSDFSSGSDKFQTSRLKIMVGP